MSGKITGLNNIETGKRIKEALKTSGYTVTDISVKLNISKSAIYMWLRGESMPDLENLFILAQITGTKVDDLVIYYPIDLDEIDKNAA